MTLALPHTISGTAPNADAQDIQDNDEFLRDAIDDYHALYKTVLYGTGLLAAGQTTAVRYINQGGTAGAVANASASTLFVPAMVYISDELFSVLGYDRKFRLSVATSTGAVNPTGNVTYGLYSVTFSSTTGQLILSTGGASVASDVTVAMSAGHERIDVGSDFTISTPGLYALSMSNTNTIAANAMVMAGVVLQYRNV